MTFLSEPADSAPVRAKYDADLASYGFVMNPSHVWVVTWGRPIEES